MFIFYSLSNWIVIFNRNFILRTCHSQKILWSNSSHCCHSITWAQARCSLKDNQADLRMFSCDCQEWWRRLWVRWAVRASAMCSSEVEELSSICLRLTTTQVNFLTLARLLRFCFLPAIMSSISDYVDLGQPMFWCEWRCGSSSASNGDPASGCTWWVSKLTRDATQCLWLVLSSTQPFGSKQDMKYPPSVQVTH